MNVKTRATFVLWKKAYILVLNLFQLLIFYGSILIKLLVLYNKPKEIYITCAKKNVEHLEMESGLEMYIWCLQIWQMFYIFNLNSRSKIWASSRLNMKHRKEMRAKCSRTHIWRMFFSMFLEKTIWRKLLKTWYVSTVCIFLQENGSIVAVGCTKHLIHPQFKLSSVSYVETILYYLNVCILFSRLDIQLDNNSQDVEQVNVLWTKDGSGIPWL